MNDSRFRRAEELFQQAADLPPERRSAFLDEHAASDPGLRAEVESLLAHLDGDRVASLAAVATGPDAAFIGQRIGPYEIVELIGEGGFGSVYRAEQEEPIRRQVAFKIIKLGMDTRQVIARFETERQALALMNHPNIARVFDAGSTEAGRPYFVMELVPGRPITEFSNAHRLPLGDRLRLFVQVCRAVQHAHHKGIVHRDIKPSNVLVSVEDESPLPKVIDFGIAKATDRRLASFTVATGLREFIGTPEYMSPEQAGQGGDIDTRADIYSLGVLLYVLLTGETPYDRSSLRNASYEEIQRVIREEVPILPSRRIDRIARDRDRSADVRQVAPPILGRFLRGDLDWIVMKALEKDRNRRYETAADLAADVQRHLNHEPVRAGPPGRGYRFRKLVRRHRVGFSAALLVVVALFAGLTVAITGLVEANRAKRALERQRDIAEAARQRESAQRERAQASAQMAEREAEKLRAVQAFLQSMLASANPGKALNPEVTVRAVLDGATRNLDGGALAGQPEVEAAVRMTLGQTYGALGSYATAIPHIRAAARLYRGALGNDAPPTFAAVNLLAALLLRDGKTAEVEPLMRRTLDHARRVLGDEHPQTLVALDTFAVSLWRLGRLVEAEALHRRNLRIKLRVFGEEHVETLRSMVTLASTLQAQGKVAEAETLLRKTADIEYRMLGPEHPNTLATRSALACLQATRGRSDEAEAAHRAVWEARRRVLGRFHPETRRSLVNLMILLQQRGKLRESRPLVVELIATHRWAAEQPGANARVLHQYGRLLLFCRPDDLQDPEAARPVIERAVTLTGASDADMLHSLALACRRTGDPRRAISTLEKAVALDATPRAHPHTLREKQLIDWSMEDRGLLGLVEAQAFILAARK